jgi:tetratricopeptide (TPR) repeat protein
MPVVLRAASTDPDLAAATRALELVGADPRRALALADVVLQRIEVGPEAAAVAGRAGALAALGLGRVVEARRRFEGARDRAIANGMVARLPEIQIGLAIVLLQCEEPEAAMAETDSALELATDEALLGQVQAQRATILMRLGRYPEALAQATVALATCRSAELPGPVARLLSNQGIVHAYLGQYSHAEAELREALELFRKQGSDLSAANVVHNLGFVAARRGDVPAALAYFDDAYLEYARLDVPSHAALTDRCEVLMSVRLLPEARAAATEAVEGLAKTGQAADLAEARLMLGEVALACGDFATAKAAAEQAAEALGRQGRAGWAVLAGFVAARARWGTQLAAVREGGFGDAGQGDQRAASRSVDRRAELLGTVEEATDLSVGLTAAGWRVHALEALITAARVALAIGDNARAVAVLATAPVARSAEYGTSSDERVRAWYAVALGALASGDREATLRALERGLQDAEDHRAAFGATELRARATLGSSELAELGLGIVLEQGSAPAVLEWSERWRARSLWPPEVLPPADDDLADRLTELRHTVAALEIAVQAGESDGAEARGLARRRRRLEGGIRQRSLARGRQHRSAPPVPSAPDIQRRLAASASGTGAIVELVAVGGELHAVICSRAACVVRRLGRMGEMRRWRAAVRFGLGRLAAGRSSPASLRAAASLLLRAALEADRWLIDPIRGDLATALTAEHPELVIVPTGALHSLPWAVLASLRACPVSLAPSIALFLDRSSQPGRAGDSPRPGRAGDTVLVAGPGVPSALEEIAALGRLYPGAAVLTGSDATARRVAAAMAPATTVHISAHGRFRTDNALFSAFDLADGPLTVYELEQMGVAPQLLVLSSCDAGRSDVQPFDELMGATATMLSLGCRAIVASVLPVPDAGAPAVMVDFHTRVLSGVAPAAALSLSQAARGVTSFSADDLAERSLPVLEAVAAAGFVCVGAGGRFAPGPP